MPERGCSRRQVDLTSRLEPRDDPERAVAFRSPDDHTFIIGRPDLAGACVASSQGGVLAAEREQLAVEGERTRVLRQHVLAPLQVTRREGCFALRVRYPLAATLVCKVWKRGELGAASFSHDTAKTG